MEPRKASSTFPLNAGRNAESDIQPRTLLVGILLLLCGLYMLMARESYMGDFRAFYVAALATQDHLDPYKNQVDVDEKYADGTLDRVDSRFIYPPSALFFFAPLAKLPYRFAKLAFAGVMVLLMTGILVFFYQRFSGSMVVFVALFITLPMVANIDAGQIDILILALLLAAFYFGDGWKAGACLGVAISIKLAPIFAIGWFLGQRRWRTVIWSLLLTGGLTVLAIGRWGTSRYSEFLLHLKDHTKWHGPMLHHQFQTLRLVGSRIIEEGDSAFTLNRGIYGYLQNPLLPLGKYGGVVGLLLVLGYLVWLFFTAKGKGLSSEAGFFGFLVVAPFANMLLWEMGIVACFPLLLLLVHRSRTPAKTALWLLVPLFLPFGIVADHLFTLWLVVAAFCLWRMTRSMGTQIGGDEAVPASPVLPC
jgi:hypothetical protein